MIDPSENMPNIPTSAFPEDSTNTKDFYRTRSLLLIRVGTFCTGCCLYNIAIELGEFDISGIRRFCSSIDKL